MSDKAIYLLGTPQIKQAGEIVTLSHQKAVALLAYLAATQRPHSRDALCGLLWPDEEQGKARAELRRMLWSINKGLGQGWLDSNRQTVGLAKTAALYTDIHHFDQLLTSWQQHNHDSKTLYAQCAADLTAAVDLYQDDFMAGFVLPDSDNFEGWQQQQAAEKRQALEEALDKLLYWHLARGDSLLIKMAQQRLKLNPTHEQTHRLLMVHYVREKQQAAALAQYQTCVAALAAELALEPTNETTSLHQQIRSGRVLDDQWQALIDTPYHIIAPEAPRPQPIQTTKSPISKSPTTNNHNLPAEVTPFVGRKAEIKRLLELVSNEKIRFVSIVAPGGMGKTRLALEVGQQLLDRFSDGVFFVELAPLKDGNSIIPALAEAVGYAFQQNGRSQKQQILDYLANKHTLLIFDNFEHLLDSASLISELLQAAQQLKLLATSRQRLSQHGETLFPLGGMGLPDWRSTETAFNYASVQLFQQTAQRARPDFQLTAVNLSDIIRICQLVAGMPLGIVLAASWMSLLSAKEIVNEIQDGLDILESEGGEVVERQRSIRVVFDSTWQMLNEREQSAFMKMSLFRGGFSREAAQKVTSAGLRQLQSLVHKSLIYRDAETGRYQIHELLRQYAEEQLASSGQAEQATADYIGYFLTFLAHQTAALKGHTQLETLRRIENDFDNIRASWLTAIANGAYDLLDGAVEAMYLFCFLNSRLEDGKDLFDTARFNESEVAHPIWQRFGIRFYSTEGETAVLIDTFENSLVLAQQRGDQAEAAFCHVTLATLAHYVVQNPMQAIEQYEQAVAIYRQLGEDYHLANTLSKLAEAYQMTGQAEKTWQHVNEAYTTQQQIGDKLGEADSLRALAMAAFMQGSYKPSFNHLEAALDIWQHANYLVGQATSQLFSGYMYVMGGKIDFGRQRIKVALETAVNIVDYSTQAWCHVLLAVTEGAVGNDRLAKEHLSSARAIETDPFRQTGAGDPFIQLSIHWAHMILCAADGKLDEIRRLLPDNLNFSYQVGSHPYLTFFIPFVAMLRADDGQFEAATELLGLTFAQPPGGHEWMEEWVVLNQLRSELQAKLGKTAFQAAWQRGQLLDLYTTVQTLLAELST
ncbi:MAG: BTAD domain-containing putative transcriptional regulator [Chloroflexota bacterium]